jgi:UDP-N-acetylglucosamine:LPS N-acetylglucosamine transferase
MVLIGQGVSGGHINKYQALVSTVNNRKWRFFSSTA